MADFRPFEGLRYNQQITGDLSDIVSPPFDTISTELQRSLYQRSQYNVVRLELGETRPTDTDQDNRYTRSGALLSEWQDQGVLVLDTEPGYYLVQHSFTAEGQERSRLELMGCVRLEPYDRRVVLPHEYTRDEDKRDRLALMQACNANLSAIMCLYRDEERKLTPVFERAMAGRPLAELTDPGQQHYRLFKIEDPEEVLGISEAMAARPLYIADGHHRYETALAYQGLRAREGGADHTEDAGHNYVMMGLIEFDDPGLMVLPYHRVLGGLAEATLVQVRDKLSELFEFQPYHGSLTEFLGEIQSRGGDGLALGLMDPASNETQLLTAKKGLDLEAWGLLAGSEAWVLEEQLLRPLLGESFAACIDYVHDGEEAERKVRADELQMAFFLKPFPLDLFARIMDAGQRLPPKSTFFYPKLPTGLVLNLLEGSI